MKNILVITRWFPDERNPTKCVFVKNILDAQSKDSRYEYTLIAPSPYFSSLFRHIIKKNALDVSSVNRYEPVMYKIYRPKYFKLPNRISEKLDWRNYFKSIIETIKVNNLSFDLIHSHGLYPDGYVAVKIGELFNVPVVAHAHDCYFSEIVSKHNDEIKYIMKYASRALAVSKFQKDIIKNMFPGYANKIEIVYNGVDIDRFSSFPLKSADEFKMCFIGHLIDRKGIDHLIKAISIVSKEIKTSLDIYGAGENELKYQRLAKKYGVGGIINFKGLMLNKDIAKYLGSYSLLILPSHYETFGIVLIEAMACGVPVVASRVGPIPEIVSSDEVGVLVEPGDSQALAEGIKKAYAKRWDGRKIREHAKKFSIDKTANNIGMIYDEVLNTKERNVNV